MAESKRNQETMKLTMKMGGGGIGAVVLLGGALATAALASAFVVGRNGRSSGHKSTPAPGIKKQQSPSSGEIKEVESDKDTVFVVSNHESTLDANPIVEEINAETPAILCSISPKKLETDAISDGLIIVIEEKTSSLDGKLQFEPQNDDGAVTIELTKDDADDESPKEIQDPGEEVLIEEESTEIEPTDEYDDEVRETIHREAVGITEKKPRQEENHDEVCCDHEEEEIKVISVDDKEVEMKSDHLEERHVIDNGEMVFSESDSEDGQKAVQPVLESHVIIEHEHVNGDEKKDIVEIVNQPDELIVVEKRADPIEVKVEDIIPCDIKEEENPMLKEELISPQNVEVTKDCESELEGEIIEKQVEEEVMISPENIEVVESIEANINETSLEFDVVQAKQDDEDEDVEETEGSSKTIAIESDDSVTEKISEDETVLCNEARLVDREVGGKIQEDKAVKKGECDSKDSRMVGDDLSFEHVHQEKSEHDFGNLEKTFTIKKYVMNDRLTNSTNRRITAILSVVSSLSCSWFFGLSSAELCLAVFLTMVMSSMVIE